MRPSGIRVPLLAGALLLAAAAAPAAAAEDSCLQCHGGLAEARLSDPVRRTAGDVHFSKGLACVSCHGGDGTAAAKEAAHDPAKGYVGAPRGEAEVRACARCHSDAAFMRNFDPAIRVDQEAQYRQSHHGKKLAGGDAKVATCSSCHGNHGVKSADDPTSPVYPTHVPDTCGRCHGDPKAMEGRKIPTDVVAKFRSSVHGRALLERGDLAAPACNSCHGNHGATPPEVANVANVCGTCHQQQATLFRGSRKKADFDRNDQPECVLCHQHHDIAAPSDAMLGTGEASVCLQCHEDEDDEGRRASVKWEKGFADLVARLESSRALLDRAEEAGMEVSEPLYRLTEARDALTEARVLIHGFETGKVLEKIEAGAKIAEETRKDGEAALAEIDYRRLGLYVSLACILVLALGLWLKIRQVDARAAGAGRP
jgi:predicted CXXCH cytochrome family protein